MKTTSDFLKMKKNGEKITMITAYDYPSAKLSEQAGVDMILVGDSLGMVVLGYDSTVPVTIDDMIHHTKAVRRGAPSTFTVTDMPFMSYHLSMENTMTNAKRMVQESGAHALKVEGGGDTIHVISSLTSAGIPVVGHLGLTPQSVGVLGGYKVQGKDIESAKKMIQEARRTEEAGAMALVLECVPQQLAKEIADQLTIPVIGIGAGAGVNGQVLVFHDVITYGVERVPKFVKTYADAQTPIKDGIMNYVTEVKSSAFPQEEHSFNMKEETLHRLYGGA
ncbi:3-methyl-2-oxobutanoate hydroxymethyltransferase [Bacillus sp. THAF10]|uniref:3-methyl-2-oxobutanoate hydroxymethyltransferase n=1 Tax=Bacillus sp. THAF10 TaxID=2587848 RepID=UPI001268BC06|nr:3-methyl-2-oxobutanoate hydroxymethyltransferase [Bacillus sp. THAF10]QFT89372.1 3-methyl-2-oxobutanoate hydroxymethyltransferase [Bacillus sp. THAF10]